MTLDAPRGTGLLICNADLFAPEPCGKTSIAAIHGKTVSVTTDAEDALSRIPGIETIDAGGLRLVPGLIDQHIHFVGGGDANGPLGRVSELTAV